MIVIETRGRKNKYDTDEERLDAIKKSKRDYYNRNKQRICEYQRSRYKDSHPDREQLLALWNEVKNLERIVSY